MFNCFSALLKAVAVVLCGPAETNTPSWNRPDAARSDDVAVLPWELERKSQLRGRRHFDKTYASVRARQRQRCHAPPLDFNPLTWGIALAFIHGAYQFVAFRLEKTFNGLYNVPNSWCDRAFLEKIQQGSAERSWLSWWFRPRQRESSLYPSHGSPLLPALQACRTLAQVATLLRFSFHHHALATVWLPWMTVGGSNSSVVLVQARGDGSMAVWVVRWAPRPSTDPHPHSVRYRILGPPRRRPERQPRPLIYAPYTPSVLLEQRVMLDSGEEWGVLICATWWSVELLILSPDALALLPRRATNNGDLVCVPTVVCSSLPLPNVTCIEAVNGPHGPLAVLVGELEVFTSTELTPPSWLTANAQHDETYTFHCTFTAGVDVSVLINVTARQLLLATTGQAPTLLAYTADSPLAALVDLALSGALFVDMSVLLPTLATLFSPFDGHTSSRPLPSRPLALPVSVPVVHPAGLIKSMACHVEAVACGAPFPARPVHLDFSGSMPVLCVPRLPGHFMDEGLRTLAMQPAAVPAPLILPTMTVPTPLKQLRPSSPKPQNAAPRVAKIEAPPAAIAPAVKAPLPALPKPTSAPVRKQTAAPRLHNLLPHVRVQPLIVARATLPREVNVEQYFTVTTPKEKEVTEQTGADLNSPTFQMAFKAAQRAGVKKEAASPSHVVQKDDASTLAEITLLAPQASNNGPSLHTPRSPTTISRRASTLPCPDMDAPVGALAQPQAESRRRSANFEVDLTTLRDTSLPSGHVDNLVLSANQARRLPSPSSLHLPRTPLSPCTVQDTSDSCPSTPTPPSSQTASSSSPSTSSPRTAAAHDQATRHSTGSSISAAVSDTGSEIDEDVDPSDDGIRLPEAPLTSPALRREDLFPSLTNATLSHFTSEELRTIARRSQLHKDMPSIAHDGKLGSGGFSLVVKVGPNQGYDQAYALKITHLGKAYKDNGWRLFNMLDLQKESRILARLSSVEPSVVVGQVAWGFGGPGDCLLLSLMELAEGGTLHDYKNLLPLEGAYYVFVALLHAVRVLSEHGILPYDIKPHNVLLMANGEPRLCDLNIAVEVDNPPCFDDRAKYAFGTDDFQSPERKLGLSLDVRGDLYSLAVTMRWAVPGRWPRFPKCIKLCANRDISKRPTLEELLADPSVQAVDISKVHPQVVEMIAKRRAEEAEQLRLDEEIEAQALLDQRDEEVGHVSTSSSGVSLATAGSGPTAAGKVSSSPLRELPRDRDLGYEDLFCSGLHNSTVELVADAELLGLSDAALNASAQIKLGSLQSLGSGSVASVLLVGPAQGYKGTFALKVVRLSSLVREMGREAVGAMELQREFMLLAQAATANRPLPIVMQYGWAVVREAGLLVSLMEVGEAGDMSCFAGMLKYDEVCFVGRQLLEALHWLLTDMDFEYCDMKPENVLCMADGRVRLGDLNAALSVTAPREQRFSRGSSDYMAPEIKYHHGFISDDGRADVFSWAKVLLFVASNPSSLDELGRCLSPEVHTRPNYTELLCQGWLRYAPTNPPQSFVDKTKARAIKLGRYQPAEPPSPFTGTVSTGAQEVGPLSVGPSAWAPPSGTTASPLWGQPSSAPLADWGNTFSVHQPAVEERLPSFLVGPSMGRQEQLDVGTDMDDGGLGIGKGGLLLGSLLGGDDHDEKEEEEDDKDGKRRGGQGLWGLGDDHSPFFHKKDDDDDNAGAGGAVGGGASLGGVTSGNVFGQQWSNWGNSQQGSSTWATQGQRGGGSQARDAWATGFGTSRTDEGDFLAGITSHVLFEGEKNSRKPDKLGYDELFYGCSITNEVVSMMPTALHTTHPGDRTDDCPTILSILTLGAGVFSSVYLVGPRQGYDRVLALKVSDLRALNCMRYQEEVSWLQNESRLLAVIREDQELQSYVPKQIGWTVYWPGALLVNLLETAEGGSLEKYAEALDEEALRYVLRRLVKALDLLLLRHKIEHCDVKPGNSLVMRDGRCLLADFNCALPVSDDRYMRVQRGDQNWRAPETTQVLFTDINGCKISPPNVTADGRADVYSLGKMVPFLLKPLHTLSAAGQACHQSMMATEAVDRPTFEQLLEGEWLGGAPIEPPMSWTSLVEKQVMAFDEDLAKRLAAEGSVV